MMEYKYGEELKATARTMITPGKGLLAADESTGTIAKRFASIQVENNEPNRRAYRELLFTSAGIEHISGVIMYDETLFQKTVDGVPFVKVLQDHHVISGIKTDLGLGVIPNTYNESFTKGISDLAERSKKYYEAGARFAKWRATYTISNEKCTPSWLSIHENAHTLAMYAAISQANGLVPIVEPEVLMDGVHDLATCERVTTMVLTEVYKELHLHGVLLEGTILKPNMICPGADYTGAKYKATDIAEATIRVLRRCVPTAVPGIMFLSGGQSEEEASILLNAINQVPGPKPWALSFSFGRALQKSCLQAWKGKAENAEAAKKAFGVRSKANSDAQLGTYKPSSEAINGLKLFVV